jgi:hypothetical protein
LNNLDAMYTNRHDDMTSMHNLSTEEKLLLFQKNIELRTRENLKQQVNEFVRFMKDQLFFRWINFVKMKLKKYVMMNV